MPPALAEVLKAEQPDSVDDLRLLQDQVRRVVELARPITVSVELGGSVGSGVLISPEGLVLTAGHVCGEPNQKVWVRFPDNVRVRGVSLGVNHEVDSGLVRITDPPSKLLEQRAAGAAAIEPAGSASDAVGPAITEADADEWPFVPLAEKDAEPGDWVVGLGQPNGYVAGRAPPVRLGRVLTRRGDAVTTDTTLVGGDSGGPLLNLRGEVVGIHSKIGQRITSNYHVTATAFRREWDRLVDGRMTGAPEGEDPDEWRPLVGLAVRNQEDRVLVTQVFPGGAAEQAGVRVGDELLRLGEQQVSSLSDLSSALAALAPYDRTQLELRRDGEAVELEVWLGRAPNDFPGAWPQAGTAEEDRD
ncbi:trypsin-like peptidase domain-containing protein [Botrimarina sp.]|uniref:S1C family serine protease n=1 Tax=Botrimarina sp. TaxID=2795802 RepID=UPI0032EF4A28